MRFVSQIFSGTPLAISRSMARVVATLTLLVCLAPAASWAKDDRWRNLNPREKDQIRQNYQRWQNLPPQDREHLKQEWNRFQSLPPDQQDQLKQKYEDMRRRRNR